MSLNISDARIHVNQYKTILLLGENFFYNINEITKEILADNGTQANKNLILGFAIIHFLKSFTKLNDEKIAEVLVKVFPEPPESEPSDEDKAYIQQLATTAVANNVDLAVLLSKAMKAFLANYKVDDETSQSILNKINSIPSDLRAAKVLAELYKA